MHRTRPLVACLALALVLVLSGCSDGEAESGDDSVAPSETAASGNEPTGDGDTAAGDDEGGDAAGSADAPSAPGLTAPAEAGADTTIPGLLTDEEFSLAVGRVMGAEDGFCENLWAFVELDLPDTATSEQVRLVVAVVGEFSRRLGATAGPEDNEVVGVVDGLAREVAAAARRLDDDPAGFNDFEPSAELQARYSAAVPPAVQRCGPVPSNDPYADDTGE